jgi:hypothetical protein
LSLILTAVSFLWPSEKWIGWLALSVASLSGVVWLIVEVRNWLKSKNRRSQGSLLSKRAGIATALVISIVLATLSALWAQHPVHPLFQEAYELHKGKLGKAEGKPKAVEWAYHAQHERATAILLGGIRTVYLLHHNSSKELVGLPDEGVTRSDSYWWNDGEIIKRFTAKFGVEGGTPPPELFPPYGPVAKGWYTNPDNWHKIGWRRRHCMYWREIVYVQRFQRGLIVGSLRHVPESEDDQYGRIFVLLTDEHRWEDEADTRNAGPLCTLPNQQQIKTE